METFKTLYRDAIEFLDAKQAYFLTHVLNLGTPISTTEIETAAVGLEDEELVFWINPDFAKLLDGPGLAFVLSHETLHAKLKHPFLSKNFSNHDLYNMAADAVINDYLVNILNIDLARVEGLDFVTGQNTIGFDCEWFSVREVYEMLSSQTQNTITLEVSCNGGKPMQGAPSPTTGENTTVMPPGDNPADTMEDQENKSEYNLADFLEENSLHPWPDSLPQVEFENNSYTISPEISPTITVTLDENLTLNWVELLRNVIPDYGVSGSKKSRASVSYHNRPRKLAGFYARGVDVALPVVRPNNRGNLKNRSLPRVVLALDTSGSISAATVKLFLSLARSVPEAKAEVFVCTFTTGYRKLDLSNPKYVSGGTDFSAIERFIQQEVVTQTNSKYPDMVIVVTDGAARFNTVAPTKQQVSSWQWLINSKRNAELFQRNILAGRGKRLSNIDTSSVFLLGDFIK